MAEEEMDDLDGLDDFGSDDFGDQLDDFMDADLGEGEEAEGDSELDSFFEDLSTIDDLEVEEPAEEEEVAEEPQEFTEDEPEDFIEEEPEEEPEPDEPTEKKPILIPAIISAVIGGVLGAIAVGVMYWLSYEPEPEPLPLPPEPTLPVTLPMTTLPPVTVVVTAPPTTLPPLKPPPPQKKVTHYVQVANCIYQECVDDYRFLLKRFGYQTTLVMENEKTPMTEVVSLQAMGEEEASRWVNRINQENQLPGQAYRKNMGSLFRVSLGLFPDLDTAARVKVYLNQLYSKQLVFEAKQASQSIRYSKIRAGGFDSREEAVQLQRILLNKDARFRGAFIVSVTE